MAKSSRSKTTQPERILMPGSEKFYPGIYKRKVSDRKDPDKIDFQFYVFFKRDGQMISQKVGREIADRMTAERASVLREMLMSGERQLAKDIKKEPIKLKRRRYTIDLLFKNYIEKIENQGSSNITIRAIKNRYKKHLAKFATKTIDELSFSEIENFKIKLLKKLEPATVHAILATLKAIINWGVKNNKCQPLSFKIEMPEVDNQVTEDLTKEQLKKLLNAIENDHNQIVGNMMKLALFTGMRRSEIFKLKWKNVNFENNTIFIKDPKGKSNHIPMNQKARSILEKQSKENDFVFVNNRGAPFINCAIAAKRIVRNAGLPKEFRPFHGLRHSFASMLASSGQVDMYHLQKLLNHQSPQMTQRYAHLRDEALKKASSVMDDIVNEREE